MTTIAIVAPYFVPYAGYFRVFAAADTVVLFDTVQFPSGGWVHRNRLPLVSGELGWLTLPLAKHSHGALISDLTFAPDAAERFARSMRRFPVLERAREKQSELLARVADFGSGSLADYLCDLVASLRNGFGFTTPVVRASSIAIPADLRAQDRIIAIVKALGGTRYVNPPAGRELYDAPSFAAHGIDLRFLSWFEGSHVSVLARLLAEPEADIAREIREQTVLTPATAPFG